MKKFSALCLILFLVSCIGRLYALQEYKICYNGSQRIETTKITDKDRFLWQTSPATGQQTWTTVKNWSEDAFVELSSLTSSVHVRYMRDTNNDNSGDETTTIALVTVYAQLDGGEIGADTSICYNVKPNRITYTKMPEGEDNDFEYRWYISTDGNNYNRIDGETSSSYQPDNLTGTTYFMAEVTSKACSTVEYSNKRKITVRDEFVRGTISGTQTICYDSAAGKLTGTSCTGGATAYSFQWQQAGANMQFSNATGTGAQSLEYTPGQLKNTTNYRMVYTSAMGCGMEFSDTVTVSVRPEFKAGTIGNPDTVCYNTAPGALALLRDAEGGTGEYAYQWQQSENNSNYTNINGQTGTQYQPGVLNKTLYYRLAFTSVGHCGTLYSQPIKITVYEQLTAGTIGQSESICHNTRPNEIKFTKNTTGEGGLSDYAYQWATSANGTDFSEVSGATTASFQAGNLKETAYYRVEVSSKECGTSVTSNTVKITVYDSFVPGTISAGHIICFNTTPETLRGTDCEGGSGHYSYAWEKSEDNGDFQNASGTGRTTLNFTPSQLTQSTRFRLAYTSSENCGTVHSNTLTVVVRPEFKAGTIGHPQTICYNTVPDGLEMLTEATGGDSVYTHQWQWALQGRNFDDIDDADGTAFAPAALDVTTRYRLAFTSGHDCGTVYSDPVTIEVYQKLDAGTIEKPQKICYNTIPSKIEFTAGYPRGEDNSYTYQWQRATDNNEDFEDIADGTANSFQAGNLMDTVRYRVIVTSVQCHTADTTDAVKIAVLPEFKKGVIAKSDTTICQFDYPDKFVSLQNCSGADGRFSYRWQISKNAVNFEDIASEAAHDSNYQSPALDSTRFFRLKYISNFGCGELFSDSIIHIEVHPLPAPRVVVGDRSVCNNQYDLLYFFDEIEADTKYVWDIDGGDITEHIDSAHIIVHWDKNPGTGTLYIEQTYIPLGCIDTPYYEIEILEYSSPDKTRIVRKSNTNILICEENAPGIIYEWGFRDKQTGELEIIAESNYPYAEMPHEIDFGRYDYRVSTSFQYTETTSCATVSWYGEDLAVEGAKEAQSLGIMLYPNPTSGVFYIKFVENAVLGDEVEITVTSILGNEVYRRKCRTDALNGCAIDAHLPAGLFVVRVLSGNRVYTQKLVVR